MTKYTAEKRIENGSPVLYVDGKKSIPMVYALSDIPASNPLTAQAGKNIANFSRVGINIVSTDVSLYKGWRKGGGYNPDFIFGDLTAITAANPNAHIILRLHVNPPYWWLRDHPEELCIYGKGGANYVDKGEYERLIAGDESNEMRVSLASEKWKEDAGEKIKEMLSYVANTELGGHIIGVQIAGGVYGEWHQWGFTFDPDYGKCMTQYFHKYLKEKYLTVESLREAWHNNSVTFENAALASPEMRYYANGSSFRDPSADRYIVDSLTALMRCAPDAIMYFSDIIRSCFDRTILIGAFYGYYDSWENTFVGGHLDVKRLCESGAVDYLSAPFRYDSLLRSVSGVNAARSMLESARLHGVLWFTEMDNPPKGSAEFIGGDPNYLDENIANMRKNVLEPITRGMGMWYFDHRLVLDLGYACSIYVKNGWWDHPALLNEVNTLRRITEHCFKTDYVPSADVLLIFDAEYRYYSLATDAFTDKRDSEGNERALFMSLGKCGIAYDSIYIHDIEKAELDRYKCIIFINCAYITSDKRKYINEKVKKNGRNIVWINAAGYLDENRCDVSNIEDITDFHVNIADTKGVMVFDNRYNNAEVSAPYPYSLNFAVCDNSQPLAYFKDTRQMCAAVKIKDEYTAWYFSVFPTEISLLKSIFEFSDVFTYTQNPVTLFAGNGIIVVTTDRSIYFNLNLRNGKKIAEKLEGMTTAVYSEEDGERLDIKFNEMRGIQNV